MLPIQSNRLILRSLSEQDLQTFAAYRNDSDVSRYQSWASYDITLANELYAKQSSTVFGEPDSWHQIAIVLRDCNEMIGDCCIHFCDFNDDKQVEIGFTLATQHQHKGYAV